MPVKKITLKGDFKAHGVWSMIMIGIPQSHLL
jgi:hypothetical protein